MTFSDRTSFEREAPNAVMPHGYTMDRPAMARPLAWAPTVYLLLFPILYALVYYFPGAAPFVAAPILFASYYLIIFRTQLYPVMFLIMVSRCINGFFIPHSDAAYSLMNLMTGYIPLACYGLSVWLGPDRRIGWNLLVRYKLTVLYIVVLLVYSAISPSTSVHYLQSRVAPMVMLLAALLVVPAVMDWKRVLGFFRVVAIGSLGVYLAPGYLARTDELYQSGIVFSVPIKTPLTVEGIARNAGIFFDFRIVGFFAVVFLFAALAVRSYRYRWVDVVLALGLLASTLTRGATLLAVGLAIGLALQRRGRARVVIVSLAAAGLLLGVVFASLLMGSAGKNYLASFNIFTAKRNAIEQRAGFSEYALGQFAKDPLGSGVGSLKEEDPERIVVDRGGVFHRVTDAFLAIQLAELGVVGFLLFVGSLVEILFLRSRIGAVIIAALLIVMVGTDIPDMGTYYFAFVLMLVMLITMEASRRVTPSLVLARRRPLEVHVRLREMAATALGRSPTSKAR